MCPTSPPPPQQEENERAQEEDSNDRTYQRDSMSAEIEIPLPPLPAAQDKVFYQFRVLFFRKHVKLLKWYSCLDQNHNMIFIAGPRRYA